MITKKTTSCFAFTLIEVLVVLTMAAMILTAVLMIHQRVRASAASIVDYMSQHQLQNEILQKIAEDIDRLAAPGFEATVKFRNKLDAGYYSSQLVLQNCYYGKGDKKQNYELIFWQTSYDSQDDTLTLYRMHDGLNVEDKVLEKNPEDSPSAGLFIPVASGVTFFEFRVQKGETVLSSWTSDKLPTAVRVGISFDPRQELPSGKVGVPEEAITYRTIAIDRTRMIPYQFVKMQLDLDVLDEDEDPNSLSEDQADESEISDEPVIE